MALVTLDMHAGIVWNTIEALEIIFSRCKLLTLVTRILLVNEVMNWWTL